MSVALASMDAAYGLSRLAMSGLGQLHHHHHHHHHHLLQLHQHQQLSAAREQSAPSEAAPSALRFSVVNILRPDFGRDALLTRVDKPAQPAKATPLPVASPGPGGLQARDLSRSPSSSSACNLSRSASLESLASSRSSVAGSSLSGGCSSSSSASSTSSSASSTGSSSAASGEAVDGNTQQSLWPAWIYCTRYSDRPSSGPRTRRVKRTAPKIKAPTVPDEKRPRTAFSGEQLSKLRDEFAKNKYLNEERRQKLSRELGLNEQQIKIWFQNKRAKIKKSTGHKNPLALQLMAQGLYNHSTVPVDEDGEELSR